MPLRLCSYGPARKLPLRSSWAAVALRTRQQELRRKRARWWHWRHWGRRSPTWVPFYLRALPETLGHPPPAVEDACTPQSGRDTSPFASRSEAPLLALSGGRAVARHLATPPSPDLTSSPPTSSLRIFSEGPSSSACLPGKAPASQNPLPPATSRGFHCMYCLPSGPHRILWHSAASQASSVPLAGMREAKTENWCENSSLATACCSAKAYRLCLPGLCKARRSFSGHWRGWQWTQRQCLHQSRVGARHDILRDACPLLQHFGDVVGLPPLHAVSVLVEVVLPAVDSTLCRSEVRVRT
eukprot:scaffold5657_cov270-Pinguiococcus_pyrenoidosus.AAC.6